MYLDTDSAEFDISSLTPISQSEYEYATKNYDAKISRNLSGGIKVLGSMSRLRVPED